MPNFISFDRILSSYVITPNDPETDIGKFKVKGILSDTNMETYFEFEIKVVNDPPTFK